MGMTGDFAKLKQWADRIGKMPEIPNQAAEATAPKLAAMVRSEFSTKTDPYGGAWRGIKAATLARGSSSILVRSGQLRDAVDVAATGASITVSLGVDYAQYQLNRGILPRAGDLPPKWRREVDAAASKAFKQIAEGGS